MDGNMGSWTPGSRGGRDRKVGKLSGVGWVILVFSLLAFGGLVFLGIYLR